MAELHYPPWARSAPTTLERDRKDKHNKWTSFKKAIKKPWERTSIRKSQPKKRDDRSALPPPAGLEETSFRQLQFGEFSPFGAGKQKINPLSGGGNPFLFHQLTGGGGFPNYPQPFKPYSEDVPHQKKYEEDDATKGVFSPPTPKSTRPSLRNVFPMYDSPKVNKKPVSKTKSSPVKPIHPIRPVSNERRSSTPTVVSVAPQNVLKNRPSHTSAQSTTSDITFERTGRRERRASAIRALPMLPTPEAQKSPERSPQRSPPSTQARERVSEFESKELPSDAMYLTPPTLTSNIDDGAADSSAMYGWTQQPHEQLQELEEELESDGPEGEEDNMAILTWESEKTDNELTKVNDFAEEFVRQLTLGDGHADVLY